MRTQGALRWTIFLGATAVVVYLCLLILGPFLDVMAWAIVLAITFHPLQQELVRKTGRVSLSAFIASTLVVVAFVIPLLFLSGLAMNQLLALAESLRRIFTDEAGLITAGPLRDVEAWLGDTFGLDAGAVAGWLQQHGSALARGAAEYTLTIAASVTRAVLAFIFIVFAMFLLFRDGGRFVAGILDLLPFERRRSEALLTRIQEAIYGGVYGVVVIALLQGILAGVMFWILGVPSPALWSMVTVLTSVVPVLGAAAVWVPATLYLAAASQWTQAVVLAVWGAAVISGVDNFLRPRLVGNRLGLSEFVMFFALLGGLQAFGILGIVLGPVVFAIAVSIIDVLRVEEASPEPAGAPLPQEPTTGEPG
jgi:predicted PurR-regulated permease PerM